MNKEIKFNIGVAMIVGDRKAAFLYKLQELTENTTWCEISYEEWLEIFPYLSLKTLQRMVKELQKEGYILVEKRNPDCYDHTNSYRLNPAMPI